MSENNLYQTPNADLAQGSRHSENEKNFLLKIAKNQRRLVFTFMFYFLASILIGISPPEAKPMFQFLAFPLFLVIFILNAKLSWCLYGVLGRILMITLCIIPIINFLVVLFNSSKTNKILKAAGYRVGFLGANIKEIEAA